MWKQEVIVAVWLMILGCVYILGCAESACIWGTRNAHAQEAFFCRLL